MQQTGIFAGRTEVRCPYARWGWTRGGARSGTAGLTWPGWTTRRSECPTIKASASRAA